MERRYVGSKGTSVRMSGDGDERKIEGYGAIFYDGSAGSEYELWQGVKERIMPGAFDRAIREGDDTRALFNHDANLVLGRTSAGTLALSVDQRGLKYEITPPKSRADVIEAIERGDVTGSSFGFRVTDEGWRMENDVEIREIRGVELFDVSPVTYPAYEGTSVGLRSDGKLDEAKSSRDKWLASQQQERRSVAGKQAVRLRMLEIEQGA